VGQGIHVVHIDRGPRLLSTVFLNQLAMRAHDKVLGVHGGDFFLQEARHVVMKGRVIITFEQLNQFQSCGEPFFAD
jgi:hypothetical protein